MGKIRVILKKSKILRAIYPSYVRLKSKMRFLYMCLFTKVLTEEDLIAQFAKTGLQPGDAVMLHSSMSKIGILEHGPATFVNALKRYIGSDGMIVMPTYPQKGMYAYLENYQMFDVTYTPSKDGAITEYFRKSKGVYRSAHPTHPVAAWGKGAEKLVVGHELCKTPFGYGSPFEKMLKLNVKLMLIGVNFDHLTFIRVLDDLEPDKYKHISYIPNKMYHVPVKMTNGEVVWVDTPCHDPVRFGAERWNMRLFPYMKEYITFGHLGKADTWVLKARDLYNVQVECMKKNIYTFYHYSFK